MFDCVLIPSGIQHAVHSEVRCEVNHMKVEIQPNRQSGLPMGKFCSAGGQHRLAMKPVAVAETDDRFVQIVCTRCGFEGAIQNQTLRREIADLVDYVAALEKA